MGPPVTVLVCTYNDESTIHIVLRALTRLTYQPLEIIVINDASTDQTADQIGKFSVTAIHNPVNRGLGFNLNLGLSMSKGEYLAVVQSDCEVIGPNWLDQMLEQMTDGIGVVVSQREISNFALLPAGARFFNAVAPQDLKNQSGEAMELKYCRGKADLYRTPVLRELNGWSQSFLTAGEDTDLSIRLREKGYKILLHPNATVRYLFSRRQASVRGSLKKAFLYGKTAAPLYHLHHYDGIQARTYMVILLSLLILPLPPSAGWILGIFLFLYSFTCRIQTKTSREIPFALLAFFASIPLIVLNLQRKTADFSMIPAGSLAIAGFTYLVYLSVKNTIRNYRKGESAGNLPATFLFCASWRLISGAGYIFGALERFTKQLIGIKQLEKNENPSG
jgi:glycosyltransferase involved in cell wall biosynthesis